MDKSDLPCTDAAQPPVEPSADVSLPTADSSTGRAYIVPEASELTADGASRRRFLFETGALTTGLAATPYLSAQEQVTVPRAAGPPVRTASITRMKLEVNGRSYDFTLDPRVTLLDALREHIGLMGTKKGCDRGQCGACTVLVNGRRVNSCLTLALSCDGYKVVTVEGLANGETLHPVQAAFLARDAFQCGYCTPGQICSAVGMLEEVRADSVSAATPDVRARGAVTLRQLSDDEIRERMSGNICRCGAYVNIVAAIRDVAGRERL
jgi:xanthine dehydrogenase YagT iron-sulfur-binding subunit